jgi:hypothetical protein
VSELSDVLDSEFAWRRKELTTVRNSLYAAASPAKPTHIRAGVALLYAHWEGFIKACAEAYLSFIALQRLQYNQLNPNLLALCFHGQLVSLYETHGLTAHTDFAAFVLSGLNSRARVPQHGAVETRANLNSKRLRRIVDILGLDFSPYELKRNMIDAQLLNWRNTIAHGQYLCPSEEDFETLYQQVGDLIRDFKDQVANAAATGDYRRR